MQTQLEIDSINIRNDVQVRTDITTSNISSNDYNKSDEYSAQHKDALADGDPQGKGTGHGGHTHSIPNHKLGKAMFKYSQLDTSDKSGGEYDQNGRNGVGGRTFLTTINIYNENNQYSAAIVDTAANVADGQVKF